MTLNCSLFLISEKGQVITATYTQPLWSTFNRREHLKMSKCFWCACPRCADPTEFGSYLSALNCQLCGGRILSTNPLDQKAKWKWVKNEKRKISSDGRRCFFCRLGSDPDERTQFDRHWSDPNGKKKVLLIDCRCDKCNKSFDANEIKSINDSMLAELKSTDRSDPDALDAFLKDNATTLPDR